MGLFCANIHIRSDDASAVRAAVDPAANVLEPEAGWVSLYLPELLDGGEPVILDCAGELSQRLETKAVSFWVYDSDIACYWLHDSGNLLDWHNSWPDYFGDAPADPARGNPDALADFCPEDTLREDLRRILGMDMTFAEDVIAQIATAMGIPQDRALRDYRDTTEDALPFGIPTPEEIAGLETVLPGHDLTDASETAIGMVAAAVANDVAELRHLATAGADLDEEAPAPLPGGQSLAGLGMAIPGEIPQVPMTPLIAAIAHTQAGAVTALLQLGADPNRQHALYGSPVHAAAGSGDPALLTAVLDAGGDPDTPNRQGQTPRQVLAASRQQLDALEQARGLLNSLGAASPEILDQLGPTDEMLSGWDACEEILRSRGEATD